MIEQHLSNLTSDVECESLVDLLGRRAEERPNELAYQFLQDGQTEGARLTYEQLYLESKAIGEHLFAGAQRGDRALLLYPPGHEFLLAFFGCLHAGLIAIPLSPPDSSRIKRALPRLTAVAGDHRHRWS